MGHITSAVIVVPAFEWFWHCSAVQLLSATVNDNGTALCVKLVGESETRCNDKRGSCKRNETERTAV